MPKLLRTLLVLPILVSALFVGSATAQVASVEISKREPVAGGQEFGVAGKYERIDGTITFAFEPRNRFNARIVDLERAARDNKGKVVAKAKLVVLQPIDPTKRSGVGVLEVSNRGSRAIERYFQLASGDKPDGDGLLLERGVTLIWVGWQFDLVPAPGRMTIELPVARGPRGELITGPVRADWTNDEQVTELAIAHHPDVHRPYAVHDPDSDKHRLTVRDGRAAPRTLVPRGDWKFNEDGTKIVMAKGFQPGRIYELVYIGKEPAVVGLGLAAIRDTMAYAKHGKDCEFRVGRGIAVGISQTGRFLRYFLYQGFNTDTEGRKVFDGMMILTAGAGRGSFNHRFGQPSRDAHRYSAFFFPTDVFPFSSRLQEDPVTKKLDGLFTRQHDPDHVPRVFYINTGYEYWGRAASLIHTSVDGTRDERPCDRERIYHLSSAQHVRGTPGRGNPIDNYLAYRALMLAMLDWVQVGTAPPASLYPRRSDGTAVDVPAIHDPGIPGVTWPKVAHVAYRADYGPDWDQGVITKQPPELGPAFPTLVPQVDALGNEIAGLRTLEIRVPVATYLPWRLREGMAGGNGELVDFVGGYVPLAKTEAERKDAKDPRPSLEKLYGDREGFERRVKEAAEAMVRERFLLQQDVERAVGASLAAWDRIHGGR